jgi:hypothetical protein
MGRHAADHPIRRALRGERRVKAWSRRARLAALAISLSACAQLAPLRYPPLDPAADLTLVNTREEAVQRFGPPHEVRSSDVGPVLVYRRAVVVDVNPNRYYGEDRGDRLNQYELVLLYLDGEGRIVRRAIEPE